VAQVVERETLSSRPSSIKKIFLSIQTVRLGVIIVENKRA
jgi:hypothetical protein